MQIKTQPTLLQTDTVIEESSSSKIGVGYFSKTQFPAKSNKLNKSNILSSRHKHKSNCYFVKNIHSQHLIENFEILKSENRELFDKVIHQCIQNME